MYSLPVSSVQELEVAVESFGKLISDVTADLTPVFGSKRSKKYARWWNPELTRLRRYYRRNVRIYKSLDDLESEVNMKNSLRDYKYEILRAKREDWKKFCEERASFDPWKTIKRYVGQVADVFSRCMC